ncbi:MAG: hypothetical protein JO122_00235 [Acetobacteraceae bacterium]|nr:hypothetical protein [Acetobacteraceae bacterium]
MRRALDGVGRSSGIEVEIPPVERGADATVYVITEVVKPEDTEAIATAGHPVLAVLNKADLAGGVAELSRRGDGIAVSALTREGLPALLEVIDARIGAAMEVADYAIGPGDGARLAWLYRHGEIVERHDEDAGIHVTVRLSPADRARFEHGL